MGTTEPVAGAEGAPLVTVRELVGLEDIRTLENAITDLKTKIADEAAK